MTPFDHAYITRTASFLPGEAVNNIEMGRYIGPINKTSSRMKSRILAENGIKSRHYAIDETGQSLHSVTSMGTKVLAQLQENTAHIGFLSATTTVGD